MAKTQIDYAVILEAVLISSRDAALEAQASGASVATMMAYYDVLSVAQQTAEIMGLTLADIGLADFNVESLVPTVKGG
ncbi:hypothetical protein ED236_11340 [Pseudomethylobacillus aquaticus]|uniref:Uncharacterized protein n=1 Tax=Pseudomethylobacillus aquaticus TaxID=2676064 RepID=A0A3N0UVD6_9PROT|nr:hypothetical protein [Pseudomethylobacillus aquaticus]ROH84507.1 hypothetical protein ED236_11340 [Pseudomethylobacillus aquaticus]